MVIKTFNVDEEVYKQFSAYCKKNGISMSKKVENFIRDEIVKLKIKSSEKKDEVLDKKVSVIKHSFSKYC
ncbi:hypothetical protein J4416_01755 [Candidatus Pacearchaeota archaeon]|nr:hypothetical protein [Candidatus Pacearchaeota archaeon]HLC73304.1 hypothetical protein [Candidatus Nanoarchaeia archaeon]